MGETADVRTGERGAAERRARRRHGGQANRHGHAGHEHRDEFRIHPVVLWHRQAVKLSAHPGP